MTAKHLFAWKAPDGCWYGPYADKQMAQDARSRLPRHHAGTLRLVGIRDTRDGIELIELARG